MAKYKFSQFLTPIEDPEIVIKTKSQPNIELPLYNIEVILQTPSVKVGIVFEGVEILDLEEADFMAIALAELEQFEVTKE